MTSTRTRRPPIAPTGAATDFVGGDLAAIAPEALPGQADLAWASFPCQDLSLAGGGKGMGAAEDSVKTRSGAFWLFHEKMRALRLEGRAPRAIVLENVVGVLTSHGKRDFCALVAALDDIGYRVGALTLDARWFTPQSRPRVFFVAVQKALSPLAAERLIRSGAGAALVLAGLARGASGPAARSRGRLDLVAPAGAGAPQCPIWSTCSKTSPADAPWRPPRPPSACWP